MRRTSPVFRISASSGRLSAKVRNALDGSPSAAFVATTRPLAETSQPIRNPSGSRSRTWNTRLSESGILAPGMTCSMTRSGPRTTAKSEFAESGTNRIAVTNRAAVSAAPARAAGDQRTEGASGRRAKREEGKRGKARRGSEPNARAWATRPARMRIGPHLPLSAASDCRRDGGAGAEDRRAPPPLSGRRIEPRPRSRFPSRRQLFRRKKEMGRFPGERTGRVGRRVGVRDQSSPPIGGPLPFEPGPLRGGALRPQTEIGPPVIVRGSPSSAFDISERSGRISWRVAAARPMSSATAAAAPESRARRGDRFGIGRAKTTAAASAKQSAPRFGRRR